MKKNLRIYLLGILSLMYAGSNAQDTISIEFSSEYIKDAYINIVNSQTNGESPSLISSVWTHYGEYGTGRSLIGFDFSGLREDIVVIDARLNLFHNPTSGHQGHSTIGGDNTGMICRITEHWEESTVTWDNQPATTNTNSVLIPAPENDSSDFLNVDITPIIKDMIRHPFTSDGFMIKLFSEDTLYRSLVFASSDHLDESLHPSIIINFVINVLQDSVFTLQPDEETGKDASINSSISKSFGDQQSLVSSVWEYDSEWGTGRSFVNFDLSEFNTEMSLTLAELSLFHNPSSSVAGHINNGNSNELIISRITEYWNEDDINWFNQPEVSTEDQMFIQSSNIEDQDYLNIDVTELVNKMITEANESFGFMIQLKDETNNNYNRNVVFASSNHVNSNLRPKLELYFSNATSIDDNPENSSSFEISPNPSNGHFSIKISDAAISTGAYKIVNLNGTVVLQGDFNSSTFSVDASHLSNGIYICQLLIDDKLSFRKIVIQ